MTDLETVRLLIQDVNPHDVVGGGTEYWFTDDELNAFIDLEPDLRCAAALALECLSADVAKVAKTQSAGAFSSSKDPVHVALLATAARYREQSEKDGYSDELEFATYPWAPLDRLYGTTTPLDTL